MKCPECQHDNRKGVKFCEECGNKFETKCPACNTKIPVEAKFCGECGHPLKIASEPKDSELSFEDKLDKIQRYLPKGLTEKILSQRDKIEGERKQVTVMFCDMVGSTPLTEKLGSEETYSLMNQVYEIMIRKVNDYHGTINEIRGDGILAFFGAPIALEDAPQRAILSSLAIHKEIIKLNKKIKNNKDISSILLRIGINTGPVVLGALGSDLRVQFTAIGDTINMASRMESLAEPGTTFIAEDTFKLTEGFFRFEALGAKNIKGKDQPIHVYRVIAPSSRKTRFDVGAERGLTPFTGRERELELLLDALDRARSGRGQAISIVSEAGVGKSRLLYEFRKALASEDLTFLEGKCLSYGRGAAYHPIIDILKANFDIMEKDGDLEIREKAKKGLNTLGADETSTLPYLLELLAVKDSGIDRISMSPEVKKDRIIEALNRIALQGSEVRPLIMAIEDLHWIDKSSEECLRTLLESIPGARILLIFTYRPEFVHIWGAKSYHSQIMLNRLSNRESLIMISYLLGTEELDKDLEQFILEKTEGVPFFIEELIKSLKDHKIIYTEENRYCIIKDFPEITIPATVQDVIMTRVDTLPEESKSLLQTMSVIGREFSYDLIKNIIGLADQEKKLLSQLSILKDSELLYERGIYPQSSYIFKHALTQEVAYNSLLAKKRKEIHEKIGRAIETLSPDRLEEHYEMLAYHYGHSANTSKALQYLDLANQKAVRVDAMEEAKAYFVESMKVLDAMPDTNDKKERQISLLLKQWEMFWHLNKIPEYRNFLVRYETMAEELGNQGILGQFYVRLGSCEQCSGEFDKSIKNLTNGIELCESSGNSEYIKDAYFQLQRSYYWSGDYDLCLESAEKSLNILDPDLDPSSYVYSLGIMSWVYADRGYWERAKKEGKKALKLAEKYSNSSVISFAAFSLAYMYNYKKDLARAVEYGELAAKNATTPLNRMSANATLGYALCLAGEPRKGIDLLNQTLPTVKANDYPSAVPWINVMLGEGYWLAGESEKSKQILEETLELGKHVKMKLWIGWAHLFLGEIKINNNLDKAAAHFERSVSIFTKAGAENPLAHAYSGYGRLSKHQGNIEQAREYFRKALEIFERLGTLIEPEMIIKELAELPEA